MSEPVQLHTPWIRDNANPGYIFDQRGILIIGAMPDVKSKAGYAEEVIRRVNVHDELLEACETMLDRFGHLDAGTCEREACNKARVAIARGKP